MCVFSIGRSNELLLTILDLNVYVLFLDIEFLFCYVANQGWSVRSARFCASEAKGALNGLVQCKNGIGTFILSVRQDGRCLNLYFECFSSPSLNKGPEKVPAQCPLQWKPPCPGCRFLFRPTSPMPSGPSPSKSGVSLFPRRPRPTRPTLLLHGSHIICPRCHHPKDVLLWTCSPSISPPGHLCLVPSASLPLRVLYMIPAYSRPISVSALLIWACWEEGPSERCTRWAGQHFLFMCIWNYALLTFHLLCFC